MQEASKTRNLDDKSYQIYALIDPKDSLVYYVGLSADAYVRFYAHLNSRTSSSERVKAWITKLQQAGKEPILYVLETIEAGTGAYSQACEQEQYWIAELFRAGNPLLNTVGIATPSPEGACRHLSLVHY